MIKCPLPYMHLFIGQNFTKPCCEYGPNSDLLPNDFWASKELQEIRDTLEAGKWPSGCSTCKFAEENGHLSLRQRSLQEHEMPAEPTVKYVDVRLSNKCNFACRSCEPVFSSRIAKESSVHKLEEFYGYSLDKNYIDNSKSLSEQVISYAPTLERVMFTGGEPTYIPEFYDVLDKLGDDVDIQITTNASLISDKFIDAVKHKKKLHITISLDAVGEPAEYIRYGTDWQVVDSGIKRILDLKCSVMFNTVLTAYSVQHLDSLVDYIIEHEQDAYGADMYVCTTPKHLHPCVLPATSRPNLDSCIEKLSQSTRSEDYSNAIQVLKNLQIDLQTVFHSNQTFNKFTKKLDTIRNQQYNEL